MFQKKPTRSIYRGSPGTQRGSPGKKRGSPGKQRVSPGKQIEEDQIRLNLMDLGKDLELRKTNRFTDIDDMSNFQIRAEILREENQLKIIHSNILDAISRNTELLTSLDREKNKFEVDLNKISDEKFRFFTRIFDKQISDLLDDIETNRKRYKLIHNQLKEMNNDLEKISRLGTTKRVQALNNELKLREKRQQKEVEWTVLLDRIKRRN